MTLKEYEVFKEPEVEKPAGPTPEQLAAEREDKLRQEAREKELEAAKAQARAEAMERFVRDSYARGRTAPVVDTEPARQAQEELGLSDEDILNDPTGAIAKLQAQIRRQQEEMEMYKGNSTRVISNLAKSAFKSEMAAIAKEQYAEWLMPYIEDYFRQNPEEAFNEGRVQSVYHELVGKNYQELEKLHREKTQTPNQRDRVIEPPIRTSASPEPPKKDTQLLSEEDAFMHEEMNKRLPPQYRMSPEEWNAIRTGKKYPKKISTDIQTGKARPNVSY